MPIVNPTLEQNIVQALNPTALNTLPNLSATPIAGTLILVAYGVNFYENFGFTRSGLTITWQPNSIHTGFNLSVGDLVIANYKAYSS